MAKKQDELRVLRVKSMEKNILFIIPSLVGGGAERTLINLLHKIDYKKYNIDLLVVSNNGEYLTQIPTQVNKISLFYNDFLVRILAHLQKKIGFTYFFKYIMNRKVNKEYDVAISFLDSNFTDLIFYLKCDCKRYTFVHSSYKTYNNFAKFYKNEKYRTKLINYRYKKLDAIYFVSQDAMDEFVETFGELNKMGVIYNIVDAMNVKRKSVDIELPKQKHFHFVAIGSLLPVKGFDKLVKAAKVLTDKNLEYKITIVGKGGEEAKLKNLIQEYSLENQIELIGFNSNPYPYLLNADVFVMSSVSEALPTVLIEAMILGKPVLVTNCSGCREIVDNEKFGLMAQQNEIDLANKMIQYISNPNLLDYYSKQSLERVKIFDEGLILEKYYSIFDN